MNCQEAPSTYDREKKPDEEAAVEPVNCQDAPSTYDREKKPGEEAAVEPVDCQDAIANSSEARRQPR